MLPFCLTELDPVDQASKAKHSESVATWCRKVASLVHDEFWTSQQLGLQGFAGFESASEPTMAPIFMCMRRG